MTKRILFVGPYRQNDGWGNAAKEYVRALRLTGHDIIARPIYTNFQNAVNPNYQHPEFEEFADLEAKKYDSYDVIIQNCLPYMLRYYGGVKNIHLGYIETTIKYTELFLPLNMMDELWVSTSYEKSLMEMSGITKPVHAFGIPCNPEKYTKLKDEIIKSYRDQSKNDYYFYFIGENINRKNLTGLYSAFHTEFSPRDRAKIKIKTGYSAHTAQQTSELIADQITRVKDLIRPFNPKGNHRDVFKNREEVVCGRIPEEDILRLHLNNDCFVTASRGEGFCLPAFDGLMYGSNVIGNKNSGVADYTDENVSLNYDSFKSPIVWDKTDNPQNHPNFRLTSKDFWYEPNQIELQHSMRQAYEQNFNKRENKIERMIYAHENILPSFSHESIAERMVKSL